MFFWVVPRDGKETDRNDPSSHGPKATFSSRSYISIFETYCLPGSIPTAACISQLVAVCGSWSGCSVDGLSSAGNPLSRAFDALTAV